MNRNSSEDIMTEPSGVMTFIVTIFVLALFCSVCYFAVSSVAVADSAGQAPQVANYEKKK